MSLHDTITVPPTTVQTHTVVFLHGRGDTASNFHHSLQYSRTSQNITLQECFPSFRWVFPKAGLHTASSAPGQPLVSQWFDLWSPVDFTDREELQTIGLRESVSWIRDLLAAEAALLGGRWDRIVLAGISQGAATCVHALINLNFDSLPPVASVLGERKLAAFLGFSCRMPFSGRSLEDTRKILGLEGVPDGNEVLRNTIVLLEHCVDDPLVKVENGRILRDTLRGFGANVAWTEYPGGGHWFNSPAGMDDVVTFLNTYVLGQVGTQEGAG